MRRQFYPADSRIGRAIISGKESSYGDRDRPTINLKKTTTDEQKDWLVAEKVRQLVSGAIITKDPGWAVKEICRMIEERDL